MEKPTQLNTIGIMMLVSGIVNVLYAAGLFCSIALGVLATFGLSLLCLPLLLVPLILGAFEIVVASRLMGSGKVGAQTIQIIAVLEIVSLLWGNVISAVLGILALVFYNSEEVRAHYSAQ
ncbi:MAG: hypothetical protein HYZ26_06765 [Chloroflexi bacterium]|nr:hypothetical protein [Chloroflexota bacterium]